MNCANYFGNVCREESLLVEIILCAACSSACQWLLPGAGIRGASAPCLSGCCAGIPAVAVDAISTAASAKLHKLHRWTSAPELLWSLRPCLQLVVSGRGPGLTGL